jgi:hypothetical protein
MPNSTQARWAHIPPIAAAPKASGVKFPVYDKTLAILPVAIELAFLGNALKSLTRTLDAVLMLVTFQRKQFHNLEAAACAKTPEWPRCVSNSLTDRELM